MKILRPKTKDDHQFFFFLPGLFISKYDRKEEKGIALVFAIGRLMIVLKDKEAKDEG